MAETPFQIFIKVLLINQLYISFTVCLHHILKNVLFFPEQCDIKRTILVWKGAVHA
jgi:hypothetical protein